VGALLLAAAPGAARQDLPAVISARDVTVAPVSYLGRQALKVELTGPVQARLRESGATNHPALRALRSYRHSPPTSSREDKEAPGSCSENLVLKTIIPSRKTTTQYLGEESDHEDGG
jgi:hypothetical protein